MKKISTFCIVILTFLSAYAATEPAWYNDVTSITANGQYYIYSVNGKGFMQANNSKVCALNYNTYNTEEGLLFTITKQNGGRTYSGAYNLSSYQTGTCGPVTTSTGDGTSIYWTAVNSNSFWNIHAYYKYLAIKYYAALSYSDGYSAACNLLGQKETHTGTAYRFYLISPAHYNRHWAIYLYELYKETIADYTAYQGKVPDAYYAALDNAFKTTFDVKNTAHSAEVVRNHQNTLAELYDNLASVAEAYANANSVIDALEAVEDKGEGDLTKITSDIEAAREAIEQAMTVEALNNAVTAPALKAIDPITFNTTSFVALQPLGAPAATVAGRTVTYKAADLSVINAANLPVYKGTTVLTATAAETDWYYAFVRSAQVTVEGINNEGEYALFACQGDEVEFRGETYTETVAKDFLLVNRTGGDSILHFSLTVNPAYIYNEELTIAYGAEESWQGQDLSAYEIGSHVLQAPYQTLNGCDSTYTLMLNVTKQERLELNYQVSFCEGDSAQYRDKWYFAAGEEQVEATGDVRDTLYTVLVTILPKDTIELYTDSLIVGDSLLLGDEEWYLLNGEERQLLTDTALVMEQELAFDLTRTLTNESGCDSVIVRHVVVEPKQQEPEEPSTPTGWQNVEQRMPAVKELRNGVLYIRRGESVYTVDGRRAE